MRRLTALLLSLIFLIGTLTACDKNKSSEVTIKTITSFGSSDTSAPPYARLLQDFRDTYPDIIVNDTSVKADDNWKATVRAQFDADQEPDVAFFFNAADAESFVSQGKVVSLDTIREVYPEYANNIKEEALDSIREKDGNVYCIPVMGYWEGIYCNKELFDKYNVPLITDWDSLLYAIDVFNQNGIIPISASFVEVPNYWIEHSILAVSGISRHSVNPKSAEEVPAEWSEGLGLLHDLYERNAFNEDTFMISHELAVRSFNAGEAAMILDGSWMIVDEAMADKFTVVGFPYTDKVPEEERGVLTGFSMGFYISTKAWNDPQKRDACVKYVEYMTSNESISQLCKAGAAAAQIAASETLPNYVKDGISMVQQYTMQKPIDSRLNKSAWEYLTQKVQGIVKGELEPKRVLEEMTAYNKID